LVDAGIDIDCVIEIKVPAEEIIQRLSGRRVHVDSGRVYHVTYSPPRVAGKDDVTGDDLIQREDDQEDTIRNRLEVYSNQTEPLVTFYADMAATSDSVLQYAAVDGVGETETIKQEIVKILDRF
jgi:adenylate kinase